MKKRKLFFGFIFILFIAKIYLEVDAYFYQEEMKIENVIEQEQSRILKIDGGEINFFISGEENQEVIVFLHPAFSDHHAFDKQMAFFSKKYKVITVDLIGHGLSPVLGSKDKIDSSIHHIATFLEKEKIEEAHFVGVSMGSLVAQYFGFHYPQKVKSLTVLGGYDIHVENPAVAKEQRKMQIGMIFRMIFSLKAFRKKVTEISTYTKEGKSLFFESTKHFERKSLPVMQGLENVVKNRKNIKIDYPLLILVGEHDIPLAHQMVKNWHQKLPKVKVEIIEGAGHCANIDKADEFNFLLSDFLNDL